ncbi:effector-associated constant component EACC1 [Kitasatospora purpeofusca]|uniref:effector-associated constant component EACC1 n=1 Tax=Kitasatospora purpeofusca TaxID=67352 RepID=UPI00380D5199
MDVHISVIGGETGRGNGSGTAAEAESLTDWLRGEPGLTRVTLTGRAPAPGEMGSVLDAVTVALGAGGALSVLASSLRVWFAQPRRSDVRLKIRRADGGTLELDAERVRAGDLEDLLRTALESQEPEGRAPSGSEQG